MTFESRKSFIAVVDDEQDLVCLFKDALSTIEEVQVFGFTGPQLALEHFRINHLRYNIVICDYRMPGMNGLDFLTKTKDIDPAVVRVLISAFEVGDDVFKDSKCVDRFLRKPIKMSSLIEQVEQDLKSIQVSSQI